MGKGYINTPGYSFASTGPAWRNIVDAVHRQDGRIFLQLWHVGRISHSSLLPNNAQPVAPSAIRANSQTFIATGRAAVSEPVALTASGIKETLADYRRAAGNAKEAGFDGVEIHAANGYLIDQFLQSGTNQRIDEYGGRCQSNQVSVGSGRTGPRPGTPAHRGAAVSAGDFNDMSDKDPETFHVTVARLTAWAGIPPRRESVAGGRPAVVDSLRCSAGCDTLGTVSTWPMAVSTDLRGEEAVEKRPGRRYRIRRAFHRQSRSTKAAATRSRSE